MAMFNFRSLIQEKFHSLFRRTDKTVSKSLTPEAALDVNGKLWKRASGAFVEGAHLPGRQTSGC
jgi:hypothetical protein